MTRGQNATQGCSKKVMQKCKTEVKQEGTGNQGRRIIIFLIVACKFCVCWSNVCSIYFEIICFHMFRILNCFSNQYFPENQFWTSGGRRTVGGGGEGPGAGGGCGGGDAESGKRVQAKCM